MTAARELPSGSRRRTKAVYPAGGTQVKHECFWSDEGGQDLIEYTLLLAMVCLASAALFMASGNATKSIWAATGNNLDKAKSAAS
jgi:Flp pilus assembly pilin Flp